MASPHIGLIGATQPRPGCGQLPVRGECGLRWPQLKHRRPQLSVTQSGGFTYKQQGISVVKCQNGLSCQLFWIRRTQGGKAETSIKSLGDGGAGLCFGKNWHWLWQGGVNKVWGLIIKTKVCCKRLVLAKLRNFNKLVGQMAKSAGNKAKNNYTSRSFHIENLVFI